MQQFLNQIFTFVAKPADWKVENGVCAVWQMLFRHFESVDICEHNSSREIWIAIHFNLEFEFHFL